MSGNDPQAAAREFVGAWFRIKIPMAASAYKRKIMLICIWRQAEFGQ